MSRRRPLLAALIALLLLPAAAQAACRGAGEPVDAHHVARATRATLCLLNRARAQHGLAKLHGNRALRRAAARYSRRMVRERFFDHFAPDGSSPMARVRASGYLRSGLSFTVGENLAWGGGSLGTPKAIVRQWLHSAGHRANILSGAFHDIGIGVAPGTPFGYDGATYTTDFGARR